MTTRTGVTVRIVSHGCKLNQFEGEAIGGSFERSGFTVIRGNDRGEARVTVVNTCTVTEKSDRKSRHAVLRAAHAKKSGGVLIVTGCYAATDAGRLAAIRGVDFVVGNDRKASIPGIVASVLECGVPGAAETGAPEDPRGAGDAFFDLEDPQKPHRCRAFVKIQDGCSSGCTYCKVPIARGVSRSRRFDDVLRYARALAEAGFAELVLTGVNIGDYRQGDAGLPDLLSALLELPGGFRIRLSSIEPMHFGEGLFALVPHPRIAPHFHIPLQSGSDGILHKMGRPYTVLRYLAAVERIRRLRPESHISTDLIVGFPGEGDGDFEGTVAAAQRARFSSMHVFKYSPRGGTPAAGLRDGVPCAVKEARSARLIRLRDRMNEGFRRSFVGTVREAVIEVKGRELIAVTDNYIRVGVRPGGAAGADPGSLKGRVRPVMITEATPRVTRGVIL
jgi:threonylcarbamoyladenosine tRNA methylthiotransferase MtaB